MAIQKEVWISSIEENLFQGAEFIDMSTDHSEFVDNKTVHIPAAGGNPTVTKNRSSYPASIVQRTDSILSYNIDTYDTEPILIPDVDEIQTSYNKRQSVLGQHVSTLTDEIALNTAFAWGATLATNIVRTTGALAATAQAPSATGNRRKLTKDDVKEVAKTFDAMKVPAAGRVMLLDSQMYWELFEDDTVVGRDFAANMAQEEGVVGELYGIKLMKYNAPLLYDNTATPVKKAVGAAGAATDNLACLAWHPSFVSKAKGETKVFAEVDKVDYYGSVFSALVLHGANKLRSSEDGLIAIVQAAV